MAKKEAARRVTPQAQRSTSAPPPIAKARPGATRFHAPKAATEQTVNGIKVQATRIGYYDHVRRREGDVFDIASMQDFSEKWMEKVDPRTPDRVTTGASALRQQHDEIMRERNPGKGTPLTGDDTGDNPLRA